MNPVVYKGVIKNLGDAVSMGPINYYSSIEMDNGQVIKKVTNHGLGSKLQQAFNEGASVELHIAPWVDKIAGLQLRGLLAIKTGDGHIYATEPVSPSSLNIFLVILLVPLGLITLPLFGIGLVFLWLAWKLWSVTRKQKDLVRYLNSLNAIFI